MTRVPVGLRWGSALEIEFGGGPNCGRGRGLKTIAAILETALIERIRTQLGLPPKILARKFHE